MRTLKLPLKAEWYDMIESGIKTEEYREKKQYWIKRICNFWNRGCSIINLDGSRLPEDKCRFCREDPDYFRELLGSSNYGHFKNPHVRFTYGYTKRHMTFEVTGVTVGQGKPEWGAPEDRDVFIIKLGKRVIDNDDDR